MIRTHRTKIGYRGLNGYQSQCLVEIYRSAKNNDIVVVTDVGVGTSVTNGFEPLFEAVRDSFALNAQRIIWLEHYEGKPGREETWDLVQHDLVAEHGALNARHPRWCPLSAREVAVLLEAEDEDT